MLVHGEDTKLLSEKLEGNSTWLNVADINLSCAWQQKAGFGKATAGPFALSGLCSSVVSRVSECLAKLAGKVTIDYVHATDVGIFGSEHGMILEQYTA